MMQPTKTITKSDFFIMKYLSGYSMVQIYNQLRYIPNICTYILPKTPYFAPKKITRASFLSSRLKFVGIRPSFCPSFSWVYPSVLSVRRFYCVGLSVFPRGSTNYHTIYPAYSKHLTYILSSTYNIYYTNLFQYTSIT